MHMRVIGIDPGYGRCGVAVLESARPREILVYSSCIETPARAPFPERLAAISGECERLMREHSPEALAMERLYFNSNQKTAMQVAEVRGAILASAARVGIPSFEYTPAAVKAAVSGYGRANKRAVASMLAALLAIEKEIRHDDEYDAIAVGVAHLAIAR
ncbi:crossover junction endodeoxyribonuclease RuvC [Candidatus Kaiserbacteria bacterium CG10_big_fil_rev_8_21_14_0_10_59_10]|uniref:Crossover junction endodeoxyribonuclease RuvC n=1 Tax=Candidatus Kaiserbacteria bacterium CG10_big_fil_rev_8_21_14_0_10_59_10 TaxID=1974612 RepID=A0A2H0U7Z2_9BACT|nr:MAG: crossover junction endodeoxyribonuclease RuvC [Candidatus Kaiserbacteria bacterium CG10_big_fil_rev_8_21_14_0_10_59_10]